MKCEGTVAQSGCESSVQMDPNPVMLVLQNSKVPWSWILVFRYLEAIKVFCKTHLQKHIFLFFDREEFKHRSGGTNDFHYNQENKDPNRKSLSFRPSSDFLTFILKKLLLQRRTKKTPRYHNVCWWSKGWFNNIFQPFSLLKTLLNVFKRSFQTADKKIQVLKLQSGTFLSNFTVWRRLLWHFWKWKLQTWQKYCLTNIVCAVFAASEKNPNQNKTKLMPGIVAVVQSRMIPNTSSLFVSVLIYKMTR